MRVTYLLLAALVLANALTAFAAERPNILLIMTDDQGWGDITSHGNAKIETPVMDSIAAAGARFDRFYVSPVCAPTRASLLTGRYHLRTGVSGVTRGWETMRANELTIAEALKSGGYRTGAFGKWHNGRHYPNHPNGQGFDEFYGFLGGHWNQYFDTQLERNGQRVQTSGYITDVLTDAALGFIRQGGDQPWFCYVPYNAPHSPWEVPDKYWNKYADRGLDLKARCAYAMVDCVDENIGRLFTALEDLDLAENTIVIFLTDNGPNSTRFNGDMRGRKGSVHEGGIRVPLYVRWPGHIEPGTLIEPIAAHFDLLPTILDMVDVDKPAGPALDGRSLWPLLQGESVSWPERMIFTGRVRNGDLANPDGSVRNQRWRAVREKGKWELFDMTADPGQKQNVAAKLPEVLARLSGSYDDWLKDATSAGLDYIPIPIGHPDRPITELPANEAFLKPGGHGEGIGYIHSGGTANAWLVDWTSTDAYPQWEVEVLTAGEYELTLLYNSREADVGAKVQVELGGQTLNGKIPRAFYPDFEPNNDRVPKVDDHYEEKDWAPLNLGALNLKPGRTTLTVKALAKPGPEVMELRAVRLTRR